METGPQKAEGDSRPPLYSLSTGLFPSIARDGGPEHGALGGSVCFNVERAVGNVRTMKPRTVLWPFFGLGKS